MRARTLTLTLALSLGCSSVEPTTTPAPRASVAASDHVAEAPVTTSSAPTSPPASAGAPTWSTPTKRNSRRDDPTAGDRCESDADCAWEDPCVPDRCVGAHETAPSECKESLPAPGACVCEDRQCSLRRDDALRDVSRGSAFCDASDCALDRSRGTCSAVPASAPPGLRSRRPVDDGPGCVCEPTKQSCEAFWLEPIACKSDLDCWVEESPVRRPSKRPPGKRTPFRPCKDGPVEPLCVDGACRLGSAYRC